MVSGKGLKNYTTKIPVEKTLSEIEHLLVQHGATDIWKQYSGDGEVIGINFVVQTKHGKIPFKLPANFMAVQQVLKNQKNKGNLDRISWNIINDLEQPRRVGWRILLDWVDAQMALIDLEMVKIEQVFLPYAYDSASDSTFFEKLEKQGFAALTERTESKETKSKEKVIDVVVEGEK